MDVLNLSRSTVANRIKDLSFYDLIIKKTSGNIRCYSIDLDKIDKIMQANEWKSTRLALSGWGGYPAERKLKFH